METALSQTHVSAKVFPIFERHEQPLPQAYELRELVDDREWSARRSDFKERGMSATEAGRAVAPAVA
jgi:hypothetical protein